MIIGVAGAIVGKVAEVRPHLHGDLIWLADIDLGNGDPPVQIVFGGLRKVIVGELVPVAPPGSRATVRRNDLAEPQTKKMRARNYRGERSHGMLCSLDELGWMVGGPNEVPALRNVRIGQNLDQVPAEMWPELVEEWARAEEERLGTMVDKAVPSAPPIEPAHDKSAPATSSAPPAQPKVAA